MKTRTNEKGAAKKERGKGGRGMRKWFKNWLRSLVFDKHECRRLYLKLVTATFTNLSAEDAVLLYRLLYRPRTVNRLKQITGFDRHTLHKALHSLEQHGLIQSKRAGNITIYGWEVE